MKQYRFLFLFIVLLSMANNKLFAYAYDIAVDNADGVTIYYNYINDGKELEVVGNGDSFCYSGNIIIPENVTFMNRTRKVTSIGEKAFWLSSIQSVKIPSSISKISSSAFLNCENLVSIDIPSGVIESYAFCDCDALEKVCLGDEVTELKEHAFRCKNLSTIIIGKSIKSIGEYALEGNLKKVVVKDIAAWCSVDIDSKSGIPYPIQLYSDENTPITNLVIPEGVKTIKKGVFGGSGKHIYGNNYERIYDSVTFPTSIETISSYNNECLFKNVKVIIKDVAAWCKVDITHLSQMDYSMYSEDGSPIKHLVIPEGITELNGYIFAFCNTLESVSFPQSMKTIRGFEGCKKLSRIYMKEGVKDIGQNAFYRCCISNLRIPSSVKKIGDQAFAHNNISTVVSLIKKPFRITDYDFSENTLLNSTLYVPEGTIDLYKSTEGWKEFKYIEEGIPQEKYKLTFMVDDIEYKTYELEYGATITPEEEPTKEGYTFSGWSDIPETMPAKDVIVTGTFSINKYKLTYMVDNEVYKTDSLEYGAIITPEAEPTKEGYTFSGWSEIPETMPANDVTVTGTFTINKYKLTYMVDNEVYKTDSLEYGAIITPEPEPTKEGYTFSGWCEIPETMPAKDVIVTGTFSINKYKLTYMVDNEVYKTDSLEYGAIITPEAEPTKEGYSFSGWSEIPETMPAKDVTVTGTFSINKYKLTYMVDNEVYKTDSLEYGATITPEAEPTKERYTFSGWSEIPETMPANDVIIRGTFSKKEDVNPDLYKGSPIVGKWMLTSGGYVHTHLELKSDGTFIYTSINDVDYEEHGKFKLEDDWLFQLFSDEDDWCKNKIQLLNPMSLIMQEYDGENPKGKPDVYINTNPTPSTSIDKKILGKWKHTTEDGYKHTHLELKEDGTFQYTSVDDPEYNEYGIYRVEGDIMYQKFSDEDDWCMDLILLNNPMSLALQEYNGIEVDDEIAGYIKENPEPPTDINPLLIGKWVITAQNGNKHTHVEFKSDGTFSYTSASDETYEEHGVFRVENDIIYQMFSDEDDWELSKILSIDGENLSLVELKNDGVSCYDEVDKYKKVSSGINSVTTRSEIQDIYSIEGIKNNGLRKGINIVKMKDGAKKKVLVK